MPWMETYIFIDFYVYLPDEKYFVIGSLTKDCDV